MSANKKRCVVAAIVAALFGVGVWISGWEPERGLTALGVFVVGLYLILGATTFPFSD